jgi:DNA invertase Pin-like site-specific DNA recombinase
MLAVFAAFETDVRRERQLEGIAMAKSHGVYRGGKARLDRQRVRMLAASGRLQLRVSWGLLAAPSTGFLGTIVRIALSAVGWRERSSI